MCDADRVAEVSIRRQVLIVGARRAVVREAQPLPIAKVRVQQALIRPVEAHSPLRKGQQRVVVPHVRREQHGTAVEAIGPAHVRRRGEAGLRKGFEELIRRAQGYGVGIEVDEAPEARLPPERDLGEGGGEVGPLHEVEVGGAPVEEAVDGDEVVVDGAEGLDGRGGEGVKGDEDGEGVAGAGVAERVGEDHGAWWRWISKVRSEDSSCRTNREGMHRS